VLKQRLKIYPQKLTVSRVMWKSPYTNWQGNNKWWTGLNSKKYTLKSKKFQVKDRFATKGCPDNHVWWFWIKIF